MTHSGTAASPGSVVVFADETRLAVGAATAIGRLISDAPGGRTDLGLAGGSTPRATYRELRAMPLEWGRVDLWLADERWVPPDHPESNGRMAAAELADHVGAVFHRPRFSAALGPGESAAFYESELRRLFIEGPRLVLLGMGADGHTASLFPGTDALEAADSRWFVANRVPQLDTWRLTITPGLLRRTARVMVLVSGEAKSEVLADVLEGEQGRYPIQLLHTIPGSVTWVVDEAAASGLDATRTRRG